MRSTVNTKIPRFILIIGLVIFLILVMVTPVSAELRTIKQGATIFIGESNLDITNAVGSSNTIGWWASAASIPTTAPTKTINLAGRITDFTVTPADFVGYTGNWYPLKTDGTVAQLTAVFNVQDPTLSIAVWDFSQGTGTDMTGKSIPRGDLLGFKISTNMYAAVDPQYRPNVNAATDGYIKIKVKDMTGVTSASLYNSGGTTIPLANQFVNTPFYYWGSSVNNWYTDRLDQNGQYYYPEGTYTVWAESTLNNMKDNYWNTNEVPGPVYTGKTVTLINSFTLINKPSATITIPITSHTTAITTGQTTAVTTVPTTGQTSVVTTGQTTAVTTVPTTGQTSVVTTAPTQTITTRPTSSVEKLLEEQNKKIDEQNRLIAEQNKKIAEQSDLLSQILNYFKGIFGWK